MTNINNDPKMKAFVVLLAASVAHTPVSRVSAAVAPVNYGASKPVNGHGQVSHQPVSKPLQGEHRNTTQSKAFGSNAVVADGPNRLHGADAVASRGIHAHHAPIVAVGAGQISHQSVSTAHDEQRSIVQAKAFGVTNGSVSQADNFKGLTEIQPARGGTNKPIPVEKAVVLPLHSVAPGDAAACGKAEVHPDKVFPYTYVVSEDYTTSNFNTEEQSDGAPIRVQLPM